MKQKNNVVLQIATDPNTKAEKLRELWEQSLLPPLLLATHPNAPPGILETLLKSKEPNIRDAAAQNPNISPHTLFALGNQCPSSIWSNPAWSLWLLAEPNLVQKIPEGLLYTLISQDGIQKELRATLIPKAKKLPARFQLSLLMRKALLNVPLVRAKLARGKVTPKFLEFFTKDLSEEVRIAVAGNIATPVKFLKFLTDDKDIYVRRELTKNKSTPPNTLKFLANDKNDYVRIGVAKNKNTPPDTLKLLAKDKDKLVRREVAGNIATPVNILEFLANDKDSDVRRAVAKNEGSSLHTLEFLANDSDISVQRGVAENIATPTKLLRFLANHVSISTRRAVAANPRTPKKILILLAKDEDGYVRRAVAANPETPQKTLHTLMRGRKDKTREGKGKIQSIARENLKRRKK